MIMQCTVNRPRPNAVWRFPWRWRSRSGLEIRVIASYAADMPDPRDDDVPDDARVLRPNNFSITSAESGRQDQTIRMTRDAAGQLYTALGRALDWEGS